MGFWKTFFTSLLASVLGGIVLVLFVAVWLLGLIGSLGEKAKPKVPESAVLEVKLDRLLVEQTVDDPLEDLMADPLGEEFSAKPLSLHKVLGAIKKAKTDDRIKGIYLTTGIMGGGMAATEAVQQALVDFKTSGKFIYAYSEYFTERALYGASMADSIFVFPNHAFVEWNGLASNPMFFKGLLDKIGVEMQVFKVGKFKSAVEPYTRTGMSDEAREQTQVFLNDFWNHMLGVIQKNRGSRLKQPLHELASDLRAMNPQQAVQVGLIDGLRYEDQVLDVIRAKLGLEKKEKFKKVSISTYIDALVPERKETKNRVAIIYAEGVIDMGNSDQETAGAASLVKAIRKAREDENVKAIVLRVNSPGGSALASDLIWRELMLAREAKKVVASMGDVAASGGYYIAAPAEKIFAQGTTITGSIGIFGMFPNTQKLFEEKLGITFDRVVTNTYADFPNPNRRLEAREGEWLQRNIEAGYGRFIQVVQTGRAFKDSVSVDAIAQGRVWSGTRAQGLKLVDSLGTLQQALDYAAREAGLGDDYRVVEYPELESSLSKLLKGGKDQTALREELARRVFTPEERSILQSVRHLNDPQGLYYRAWLDWQVD